jgi:hypothetical protein
MINLEKFAARKLRFEAELKDIHALLDRIAWLRLLVFVAGVSLEVFAWRFGGFWWAPALLPLFVGFGLLIKWNGRVHRRREFWEILVQLNVEEPTRLEGKTTEGDGGLAFADKEHPYTGDLDVFGKRSLYALLDRCATVFGRTALANWLRTPADRPTVLARQEAARELAPLMDFRQLLTAEGRLPGKAQLDIAGLQAWLNTPAELSPNPFWARMTLLLPAVTVGLLVAGFMGYVPMWLGGLLFGLQALIVRQTSKLAKHHFVETDRMAGALESYAELIAHIGGQPLQSPLGQQLQAQIKTEGKPAQDEIRAIVAILQRFELRLNGLVYFFMNFLFFWDIQSILRLEAWKARNAQRVIPWFEAIGEMEALCGLAALHDGHADWVFPEIVTGALQVEGEGLGHPLIPEAQRVNNPVALPQPGLAWLVTGSNMSGKSTYLRTVGVNVLLALVGAPVCAARLRLSPVAIAASMRTADSLEENTSSFYAELKRLKNVIASVQRGQPTLFLLDEILKGTNSKDRHAGARALIRQLIAGGGTGLVSTHDLELQDLAEGLPGRILNHNFNCDVSDDGKLLFDYRLREGVCQSMNATALMRAMGIEL